MKRVTTKLKEFRDYIIIAMTESEGWIDCKELQGLHEKIKREKKCLHLKLYNPKPSKK